MYTYTLIAAGLLGLASAQSYTPPTNATFGALLTPDVTHPATRGEPIQVTWDPTGHTTDGSTVSLVLCKGPSTNCVNQPTAIVSGIPAKNAAYTWNVPCSLEPGVQNTATGYGMLIIVDGTGQFQYSTQFSVNQGSKCGGSSNSTSTTAYTSSTMSKSSSTSYPGPPSSPGWNSWTTTTTPKPTWTSPSTIHTVPTVPAEVIPSTSATAAPSPVASPSPFKGAATKISGSAAALVVAAGAAFFAL